MYAGGRVVGGEGMVPHLKTSSLEVTKQALLG